MSVRSNVNLLNDVSILYLMQGMKSNGING